MPGGAGPDVAQVGRRVRRRLFLAFSLASLLPLTAFVFVVFRYALPAVERGEATATGVIAAVILTTCAGTAIGGWIVGRLARTVSGMTMLGSHMPKLSELESRTDEIGSLVATFSRMFETIEQQANEINSFASRLDAAYRELEATNARLRETSFKDEVTGIYNRRFVSVRLEEEISRHRRFNHPVSIVLLDLDGFKAVNDELGHAVGDDTLREVAQVLMKHSRGINVVSRYGGDEFAVLLVETSKAGARLYAQRIRDVLARHQFPHGKPITASVGVASLPDDEASTAEELVKLADEALYIAKRSGKNQVATVNPEKQSPWTDERS
jgi:diguanylate cyclase (GGDEF)-like protein